jgi:hypothetical protein
MKKSIRTKVQRHKESCIALLILAMFINACGGTTPATETDRPAAPVPSATRAPDESAAIGALRMFNEAQATYFKLNRRYAITVDELVEARLLTTAPSAAETGYDFRLRPAADAQTYRLSVSPAGSSATGARYLFTDQTGIIRAETGKEATADSPAAQ